MDCRPSTFSGTEGAVGLLHWFERLETDFEVHDCPESRRVKFATGTLEGAAFTWWKAQVQMLGMAAANATPWNEFKDLIKEEFCSREDIHKLEVEFLNLQMVGSEIEVYTRRSNELATFCPTMVDPPVTPPKSTCGVSPLGSVTDQDQAINHIEHSIFLIIKVDNIIQQDMIDVQNQTFV